jgi:hypothetical protein
MPYRREVVPGIPAAALAVILLVEARRMLLPVALYAGALVAMFFNFFFSSPYGRLHFGSPGYVAQASGFLALAAIASVGAGSWKRSRIETEVTGPNPEGLGSQDGWSVRPPFEGRKTIASR